MDEIFPLSQTESRKKAPKISFHSVANVRFTLAAVRNMCARCESIWNICNRNSCLKIDGPLKQPVKGFASITGYNYVILLLHGFELLQGWDILQQQCCPASKCLHLRCHCLHFLCWIVFHGTALVSVNTLLNFPVCLFLQLSKTCLRDSTMNGAARHT